MKNGMLRAAIASLVAIALTTPALAQKSGGVLRVYHNDNPPSASLHEEVTIATLQPFMAVFNNLVIYDQTAKRNDDDTIVPDLAELWNWSPDKKVVTFKLRDGVRWHDGKPFTSADVNCTWNTIGKRDGGGARTRARNGTRTSMRSPSREIGR